MLPKTNIPKELRHRLLLRFRFACGYCRRKLDGETCEIDHIVPESRGGLTVVQNLTPACARCNRNKGSATQFEDPLTGLSVPLFHPHDDKWQEHFRHARNEVHGISVVGRATASLLFRPTDSFVPSDLLIAELDALSNPDLRADLNFAHYLRRTANFEAALRLVDELEAKFADDRDKILVSVLADQIRVDAFSHRCRASDLVHGLQVVLRQLRQPAVPRRNRLHMHRLASTLLLQRATVEALRGDSVRSKVLQLASARQHEFAAQEPTHLGPYEGIRILTLRAKYASPEDLSPTTSQVRSAVDYASTGDLRPITYLADLEAFSAHTGTAFDELLSGVWSALATSGYGSSHDYAGTIVLRRRWWALALKHSAHLDIDLLLKDIDRWKRLELRNELRELTLQVARHRPDLAHIINEHLQSRPARSKI